MDYRYEDFDLNIHADGEGFVVTARRGPLSVSEPFSPDLSKEWDLHHLEASRGTEIDAMGASLFNALIHGRVHHLYQQGKGGTSGDPSRGLRIRISLDPRDPRLRPLTRLPWEILFDSSADAHHHLALNARSPIVRTIECIEEMLPPREERLARVLLALANPTDSEPLDLEHDCASVVDTLSRIAVRPDVLRQTTRAALLQRIRDGQPHVVHFMGHGTFDEDTREGSLLLEDGQRHEDWIPASTLASFFVGRPAPRLIILAACLSSETDRKSGVGPFASVAASLIAAGLPAVIAMQSEVTDQGAIVFTDRLYRRLVQGDPIEAAVTEARMAMRADGSAPLDWAVPVLFLRGRSTPFLETTKSGPAHPTSSLTHSTIVNARDIELLITGNVYTDGKLK